MTLLTTVQAVADEIGVTSPTTLVGNADLTAKRLLRAAEAAGEDLYRAHNWSILHREHEITTEADEANYALPEDFGRLIADTLWDRSQFWQMRGALTPAQWQRQKGALIATVGLRRFVRLLQGPLAGSVLIDPTPGSADQTLVFEYVSRHWCESSGGTGQATWAADSDLFRIDDELFRMSVLWRARRSFGMVYVDERDDFDQALKRARSADLALPTVVMGRREMHMHPGIPEGSWPDA